MRITKGCGERRPWKLEENKEYVCVFVGHGSTSLVLVVAKKREVPICSARTSLTCPYSFCQAGTRTTAGDPWLCKLQRNRHELPVNMPLPNTHRFLVLRRKRTIFFLIVPVDPPQYYWPLLHVSCFLYSSNKRSQAGLDLFSNKREVTSKSRKIRIVAGRRFLLVNQLPLVLPLSIMTVYAQYRATVT